MNTNRIPSNKESSKKGSRKRSRKGSSRKGSSRKGSNLSDDRSKGKIISYTTVDNVDQTRLEAELNELLSSTRCMRSCNDGRYIYYVFHSIMFLIAIYLSNRCNKGFNLSSFLLAAFFPYLYIVYVLATQGTCGLLE